jgi:hypothetical protein
MFVLAKNNAEILFPIGKVLGYKDCKKQSVQVCDFMGGINNAFEN